MLGTMWNTMRTPKPAQRKPKNFTPPSPSYSPKNNKLGLYGAHCLTSA